MNIRQAAVLPALIALCCAHAAARQLPEPKLTPAPSTEAQARAIGEGVALHDRGDYDGAIRKYEAVLAENPSNVVAIYELAFAHSAKKDCKRALEHAQRGAQYKSDTLRHLYVLIGNCLDITGENARSIEVYKKALKLFPGDGSLHFNLAVSYKNANRLDDARKSLKAALTATPQHASSHLLLALVYFQSGYRTPALLAAARFLALEPASPRSAAAVRMLREGLRGGASPGKNPNEISITLEADPKKDEGDFSAVDMFLGLTAAAALGEKGQEKTEAQKLAAQFGSLVALLAEQGAKKRQATFVHDYYAPYFAEMKAKGHTEAFVHHALQSSGLPGVREWIDANGGRVMQFLIWSKGYKWPADLKQ